MDEIEKLIEVGAEVFGLSVDDVMGDWRAPVVSHPRQCIMVAARRLTGLSYPAIGRVFHRDHTTVQHAMRAVAMRANDFEEERINEIVERCGGNAFHTRRYPEFKSGRAA